MYNMYIYIYILCSRKLRPGRVYDAALLYEAALLYAAKIYTPPPINVYSVYLK